MFIGTNWQFSLYFTGRRGSLDQPFFTNVTVKDRYKSIFFHFLFLSDVSHLVPNYLVCFNSMAYKLLLFYHNDWYVQSILILQN